MNKESFKDYQLSDEIVKALDQLRHMNIQQKYKEKSYLLVLEKMDLVVKSQTGSGKTASFGIPICEIGRLEGK